MRVEDIIEPVRQRRLEIEGELRTLEEEYNAKRVPLNEELRTCNRLLRAAEPPQQKSTAKKSTPSPRSAQERMLTPDQYPKSGTRIGNITAAFVQSVMKKSDSEQFRVMDLRQENDFMERNLSGDATRAMDVMRSDGLVRFIKQEGTSKYYARTGDEPSPELVEALGLDEVMA